MLVLNAQWQGSGISDEIKTGAELLSKCFRKKIDFEVEIAESDLSTSNGIIGYESIFSQSINYRNYLETQKPKQITTIGGDCGIEIIPVTYLNAVHKKLGIIWLDAHADLNTPATSPSSTFHGMPLRIMLGEGDANFKKLLFSEINTNQILYVGLRETDPEEMDYIIENGIFRTKHIDYQRIMEHLLINNFEKLYVHLDLDVIDPKLFAHSKCPTPDGLNIKELENILYKLQNDFQTVGYGICEPVAKQEKDILPLEKIINIVESGTVAGDKNILS